MVSYIKGGSQAKEEARILRRILGPKKNANGEWRRHHNFQYRSHEKGNYQNADNTEIGIKVHNCFQKMKKSPDMIHIKEHT